MLIFGQPLEEEKMSHDYVTAFAGFEPTENIRVGGHIDETPVRLADSQTEPEDDVPFSSPGSYCLLARCPAHLLGQLLNTTAPPGGEGRQQQGGEIPDCILTLKHYSREQSTPFFAKNGVFV